MAGRGGLIKELVVFVLSVSFGLVLKSVGKWFNGYVC